MASRKTSRLPSSSKKEKPSQLFLDLKQGLEEALAYMQGKPGNYRVHHVYVPQVNVQQARKKLGLSQGAFSERFGIPVATLRNWEQGRRIPETPTQILLAIIDKHPRIVDDVLRGMKL